MVEKYKSFYNDRISICAYMYDVHYARIYLRKVIMVSLFHNFDEIILFF